MARMGTCCVHLGKCCAHMWHMGRAGRVPCQDPDEYLASVAASEADARKRRIQDAEAEWLAVGGMRVCVCFGEGGGLHVLMLLISRTFYLLCKQ